MRLSAVIFMTCLAFTAAPGLADDDPRLSRAGAALALAEVGISGDLPDVLILAGEMLSDLAPRGPEAARLLKDIETRARFLARGDAEYLVRIEAFALEREPDPDLVIAAPDPDLKQDSAIAGLAGPRLMSVKQAGREICTRKAPGVFACPPDGARGDFQLIFAGDPALIAVLRQASPE